jgi:hypothetical protein
MGFPNKSITPDTMVETEEGKIAPARKVKGLTFIATTLPETTSTESPALAEPNPFTAVSLAEENPFMAAPPVQTNPFVSMPTNVLIPVVHENKGSIWITLVGILVIVAVGYAGWKAIGTLTPSPVISHFDDIWQAAVKGHVQDVEYFLKKGITVDVRDEEDRTPLHWAARESKNVDVVKYLVSQGADIHAKTKWSMMPLHWAAGGNKNVDVVKYLVSQGADINARDKDGMTPLHRAAGLNTNVDVIKYLIAQGADAHAKTPGGITPLDFARHQNNVAVVRYLSSIK